MAQKRKVSIGGEWKIATGDRKVDASWTSCEESYEGASQQLEEEAIVKS